MNTRTLPLLFALAACGPDGGGDVVDGPPSDGVLPPILVSGGGVAPTPIDGIVNVYVIDASLGVPLAGIAVHLGGAGGAIQLDATTDPTGLAVLRDPGLTGPQTITASAAGRTAVTWVGVAGANVTIPLPARPQGVGTALVTGTIAGWDSLPSPSFGHYNLAVVTSSFTRDPGAADNRIPQGGTANTCVDSGLGGACDWRLTARTGQQVITAVIVDGDARGTTDPGNDTYTLIGYASSSPLTLTSGQEMNGLTLTQLPAGARVPMTVQFPSAAPGLARTIAIPMLDLGASGQIPHPLPTLVPGQASTQVIAATGAFAGSHRVIALATPNATATMPYSSSFVAAPNPSSVTLPAWLTPPSGVTGAGGTIGFTAAAGTTLAFANLIAGGTTAWSVTVFDSTRSFGLPSLSPDPLAGGGATLEVSTAEVPGFDPAQFELPAIAPAVTRVSGASGSFSR
jgi:hypothetical protein